MKVLTVLKASQLQVGDELVVRDSVLGEIHGVPVSYIAQSSPKLQIGSRVGPLYVSPDAVVAVFTEA